MIDWSDKNLPTLSNKRLTNKLLESVEREREREDAGHSNSWTAGGHMAVAAVCGGVC